MAVSLPGALSVPFGFIPCPADFFVATLGALATGVILGIITEKVIIKPVYGNHIQQILITLGFMLVLTEFIKVVWGPNQMAAKTPQVLTGSWELGNVILIKYRVFIIIVALIVFTLVQVVLKKTKIGLIVRAGVMDKEMVQALGINIKKVFMFVFIVGSAMVRSWWCFNGSLFWSCLCRNGDGICNFSI